MDTNLPIEVSWHELQHTIWRGKWLIAITSLLAAVGCYSIAKIMPKTYQASVLLSPVTESPGSSQLGAIASQFGGLTSLMGIQSNGGSMKAVSLATLQSELLTEQYIRERQLLPVLFSKLWDSDRKTWRVNDKKSIPTVWAANAYFRDAVRSVTESSKTGLVTLTISWRDPAVAAQWANELVSMTNQYLRDKAIKDSEQNVEFLKGQITKTGVVPLQQALYDLMESEIKKQMLARGSEEYALKVVDPAVAAETPSAPKARLWFLMGLLIGAACSIAIVIMRADWRSE